MPRYLVLWVCLLVCCVQSGMAVAVSSQSFSSSPNQPLRPGDYDGSLASMVCDTIDATSLPADARVVDVTIVTALEHDWIGDLVFKLESPDGSVLGLLSRPGFAEPADDGTGAIGSSSASMLATFPLTFSDQAPFDAEKMGDELSFGEVVCRDGPTQCEFFPNPDSIARPPERFADLAGESANGVWRLCIGDSVEFDTGTLVSWELHIEFDQVLFRDRFEVMD
jgi:subtilisin-like proprotein convertase family protein